VLFSRENANHNRETEFFQEIFGMHHPWSAPLFGTGKRRGIVGKANPSVVFIKGKRAAPAE
jgi:hypothetical protein